MNKTSNNIAPVTINFNKLNLNYNNPIDIGIELLKTIYYFQKIHFSDKNTTSDVASLIDIIDIYNIVSDWSILKLSNSEEQAIIKNIVPYIESFDKSFSGIEITDLDDYYNWLKIEEKNSLKD